MSSMRGLLMNRGLRGVKSFSTSAVARVHTSLNKVMLLGILGRDPEWKSFGGESDASPGAWSMSVATNKTYKKQSGEDAEVTQWHRIEYLGKKLPDSAKKGC
ncbi:hypothetical protein PhCBS80983_g02763 [Powellomyces hirtus]|uniref:Single-stranded DNA-binding protein n=1 Tax=Powellomyces hirtus TaxID=109895 RepID=A0A507E796_9FUNG|nr:hypothetical protein PhCBS80983_g02763 [Powellomyces hirtus]